MPDTMPESSLRAVLDNLEVGVVILDHASRILHSNRWLARRAGMDSEILAGQDFAEAFPAAAGTRLAQAIQHAIRDRLPSLLSPALHGTLLPLFQTPEDRARGRRMQQMIHVMPLRDGAPDAACLIQISDMTANISRERLLRQQTETLRRSTTQDALTGVANRRMFDTTLAAEFIKAQRTQQPIGLMIIDVDQFAAYNEQHGRAQGEARLVEIAAVLKDAIRPAGDLAARYGTDEFALILPGSNEAEVRHLAASLILQVATLARAHGSPYPTISIGCAAMQPSCSSEADTHTLLSSADVALFQAKHDGRNRAIYFAPEDGSFRHCD